MNRKGIWAAALAVVLVLMGCLERPQEPVTIDVLLPFTPVKNQSGSSTCWAYAMLSTIETEHILRGDSVHLSVAFIERVVERDSLAPASKRAISLTTISMMQRYGIVPYDAMPDADMPLPHKAFLYGCEYTLQEFARSVCAPGEYVAYCTDDRQPYGIEVELDIPDNWEHHHMRNLPPGSLQLLSERAIENHHPVCWEGDISEWGFKFNEGYTVTGLFSGSTTDDHSMAIVGLAHDAKGRKYFVMKNSWGNNNIHGGLMLMSFDYFLQKTILICMPRAALTPSDFLYGDNVPQK